MSPRKHPDRAASDSLARVRTLEQSPFIKLTAIERRANHKLAVLGHVEISGNVAASCRYYGVGRQAYYAWLKR